MIGAVEMIIAMALGSVLYIVHYMILNAMAIKYESYELKIKWNIVSIFLTVILALGLWIWEIQFWGIFFVFGAGIGLIVDWWLLEPYTKRMISEYQAERVVGEIKRNVDDE